VYVSKNGNVHTNSTKEGQELNNYLSGSCEMKEIFHGGRTHLLKIRVGFYTGEG
jgi:hypothetical protein